MPGNCPLSPTLRQPRSRPNTNRSSWLPSSALGDFDSEDLKAMFLPIVLEMASRPLRSHQPFNRCGRYKSYPHRLVNKTLSLFSALAQLRDSFGGGQESGTSVPGLLLAGDEGKHNSSSFERVWNSSASMLTKEPLFETDESLDALCFKQRDPSPDEEGPNRKLAMAGFPRTSNNPRPQGV